MKPLPLFIISMCDDYKKDVKGSSRNLGLHTLANLLSILKAEGPHAAKRVTARVAI